MSKQMTREQRYIVGHIHRLVGKTVTGFKVDRRGVGCLKFNDGTRGWILSDPEGNGPGHVEVVAPKEGA